MLILAQSTMYAPAWWELWIPTHTSVFLGVGVALIILLISQIVIRILHAMLERHSLVKTFRMISLTLAVYLGSVIALPPMLFQSDHIALWAHRIFALIFMLLGLRIVDWLVIKPILTRGGTAPLPKFVHQIVTIVLYVLVALGFASHTLEWPIASYLAGVGAVSVILGLALQETMGNFFSGLVLQASQPFKEGDWIEISGLEGRVVGMSWRAVTLQNGAGNYVTIPNAVMARERITNYYVPTRGTGHSFILTLEYQLPPNDAKTLLKSVALETQGVLQSPEPSVLLEDFGPVGILYRVAFTVSEATQRKAIEQAVRTNIWYRLKQKGYDIPYANRPPELGHLEKRQAAQRESQLQSCVDLLKKTQLFSQLSDEQLKSLASDSNEVLLPAGMTLYRQDDPGDSLFVVKSGVMDVLMRAADGREHDVGDVDPGQSFGELSAMTGQPRPATLRAQSDVVCVEIGRDQLNELFKQVPAVMEAMSNVVAEQQKMREDVLVKIGAKPQMAPEENRQPNVLAKMKRLFDRFSV